MLRRALKLLILALIVNAAWRLVPVYWQYLQFKEAVAETARFAGTRSEDEIRDRVLTLAERSGIPLTAEAVVVKRDPDEVWIDANYTVTVEPLPRYRRPWTFTVSAEAWTVKAGSSDRK